MICKKDVIQWFKELESYKRIDTMCTLLNMCLPFELRFLGTCLEELGRRDSQELRGMELRVNSPQDLASDMVACQKGEPTDKKIRRKMALYLALIRACNRTCVTEIFRTLDGWGDRDFLNMNDSDTLQELLLVYTMAANHPVFSFDQQCKCTQIYEKIKENKLVSDQQTHQPQPQALDQQPVHAQYQQEHRQLLPPSHQELLQSHVLHAPTMPLPHQLLPPANIMPHIPMSFPQGIHKLIQADGSIQHPVPVDPHMISMNVIPTESSPMYNQNWPRMYPQSVELYFQHPPQSASPMLSQQSSPSSSRTTSPNRNSSNSMMQQGMQIQPQQQLRNIQQRMSASLKSVRRPSAEITPPPMGQHQQMIHDMSMTSNIKQHMEDGITSNDGSGTPLQALIRNGYPRRQKPSNYTPLLHQQQQLPVNPHFQPVTNYAVNNSIAYSMQNMSITDGSGMHTMDGTLVGTAMNSNKSAGSDSGSSNGSCGEVSPPETPTISNTATNMSGLRLSSETQQQQHPQKHQQQQLSYNKHAGSTRLNGRSEKLHSVNSVGGVSSVSTVASGMYASPMPNSHPSLSQQQSQPLYGAEIILAPGGNAGAVGLMQTSLANNNNSGVANNIAVVNTTSNTGSINNNIASNPVLISSPSGVASGGGGIITNINPNPIILPSPHQQQYNATAYSYLTGAAQHQRMMTHAPPQLRLVPNEHLYSFYPIPGGGPPGAPPVTLRTTNSAPTNTNLAGTSGVIQVQPQQSAQTLTANQAIPSPAMLAATSYNPQSAPVVNNKHVSCYNCGSQSHSGPDCQEASMEDVTRSAIYKLDYSGSSSASPTVVAGSSNITIGNNAGGSGGMSDSLQIQLHQQQHHQKQHTIEGGGGPNVIGTTSTGPTLQTATIVSAVNTK